MADAGLVIRCAFSVIFCLFMSQIIFIFRRTEQLKLCIMKKILKLLSAGMLMSALCAGLAACNEPKDLELGLGKEIPRLEVKEATGTIIGIFADHGFGCFFVQVDEEFQIGETIEYVDSPGDFTTLPKDGTYDNMIQVQHKLSVEIGDRISFSFREYVAKEDFESLFIRGDGSTTTAHIPPHVPIYVITKYEIINN
jgi:hypothetical protein